ncbi:MAG TPA: mechanosensitive ion channel domain-containing protein [Candidatus Limnocylindria bacterium]|nr:mechanosensitive ion channel domain-containing protein [Candidatus Limnocylindria bacterium]
METQAWWDLPLIQGLALSPLAFVSAIAVLVGSWLLSLLLRRTLTLSAARRQIDPGVRYSLGRLLHLAIMTIAILTAIGLFGVDLGSFTVVAGALGLGIGFGLQGIAANFVAGLVLLFERPIRVGDRISLGTLDTGAVDAINGYVQAIHLRATSVLTPDNITLIVPNQELVIRTVVNWSLGDARMRIRFSVGVAYDSDTDRVKSLMEEVATAHPGTLKEPAPEVRLIETSDSALTFQLLVWIPDPRQRGGVESDLRWALVRRFREAGIVIPFPQREVKVLDGELTMRGRERAKHGSEPGSESPQRATPDASPGR